MTKELTISLNSSEINPIFNQDLIIQNSIMIYYVHL